MDLVKNFEPYLKEWCHEKHLPIPEEGKQNKVWQRAWKDYMKKLLTENYDEIKDYFMSIPLLTRKQLLQGTDSIDVQEEEEKELSSWERVQQLMKE